MSLVIEKHGTPGKTGEQAICNDGLTFATDSRRIFVSNRMDRARGPIAYRLKINEIDQKNGQGQERSRHWDRLDEDESFVVFVTMTIIVTMEAVLVVIFAIVSRSRGTEFANVDSHAARISPTTTITGRVDGDLDRIASRSLYPRLSRVGNREPIRNSSITVLATPTLK